MQRDYQTFVSMLCLELKKDSRLSDSGFRFREEEGADREDGRIVLEHCPGDGISRLCSFSIENLYRRYLRGQDIASIAEGIEEGLEEMDFRELDSITSRMKDYEKIRSRLIIRLLNYEEHKDALKDHIWRRVGDIAQVLYIRAGVQKGSVLTTAKVHKEIFNRWERSAPEVLDNALLNTCFLTPPRVYRWEKLLTDPDYEGDNFMDLQRAGVLSDAPGGNCISTTEKTNGAVAVFMPGVLERISDQLASDLYIAFTSIHEAMVHAAEHVEEDKIREVLEATIRECTDETEFLSKNVYFYDRKEGHLICLENRMECMAEKEDI